LTFVSKYAIVYIENKEGLLAKKIVLRLTRIPAGFGENRILSILGEKGKNSTLRDRKVGAQPILIIPEGNVENILDLLDRGFGIELVEWER
jgi:hypothetical protein